MRGIKLLWWLFPFFMCTQEALPGFDKVKPSPLLVFCGFIYSIHLLYFQKRTAFVDSNPRDNLVIRSMLSAVTDIFKTALAELYCPACKQHMVPPITFCVGGHNICKTCRPTVSSCPTCKQGFLETRNVALEKLSLQMKIPCPFRVFGCNEIISFKAVREHEAICDYRPQTCPVDYLRLKMICTWTGIAKDVKKHLQTAHTDLCEDYNDQHLLLLPSSNASSYSYKFLFAYNEIFCYRLQNQREIMYVVLHYVGPAENDSKYRYNVIVVDNEHTESVVVTHLVRRFTETENYVFLPKNCLKLHHDLTERFRNEKGELSVLMKILRADEGLLHDG